MVSAAIFSAGNVIRNPCVLNLYPYLDLEFKKTFFLMYVLDTVFEVAAVKNKYKTIKEIEQPCTWKCFTI